MIERGKKCINSTNFHTLFAKYTHHCENLYTPCRAIFVSLPPNIINLRMTLSHFFSESPLWVSVPIALGYFTVAVFFAVLLVRLFRKY